jgi:hypothetical protein
MQPDGSIAFTKVTIKQINIKLPKRVYGTSDLYKYEDKDLCPICAELLRTFMKGDPPPNLVPALVPLS